MKRIVAVAGAAANTFSAKGYGYVVVSETLTAAADVWSLQISHQMFGQKGAVDMVLQAKPQVKVDSIPLQIGSYVKPWVLYGKKTVTEGAERFSRLSKLLNREGGLATRSLRQIGYSAKDVNEAFIRYIDIAGMGMREERRSDADLLISFERFQLHLTQMGYLTGKTVKQLEGQMAVANQM